MNLLSLLWLLVLVSFARGGGGGGRGGRGRGSRPSVRSARLAKHAWKVQAKYGRFLGPNSLKGLKARNPFRVGNSLRGGRGRGGMDIKDIYDKVDNAYDIFSRAHGGRGGSGGGRGGGGGGGGGGLNDRGEVEIAVPVEAIGYSAFSIAQGMCGNAGQESIILGIGEDGFVEAAKESLDMSGNGAESTLISLASHPEAVEIILAEAGAFIDGAITQIMQAGEAAAMEFGATGVDFNY